MISATAAQLGFVFPDQLVELYTRLDGASSGAVFPSPDGYDMAFIPMPLDEVLVNWSGQKQLVEVGQFDDCIPQSAPEIRSVWWDPGWIPFATNGGGDFLCVDNVPTAAGQVGQVISHSHETGEHKLLSRSLADYLLDLANKLEEGQFIYDDKYGVCPASSATEEVQEQPNNLFTGMSEWHFDNALSAAEQAFKTKDYALCVAHLERFADRLDKLPASRLAFAKKKVAEARK
jgi:cell wall assembly regulator SMI1